MPAGTRARKSSYYNTIFCALAFRSFVSAELVDIVPKSVTNSSRRNGRRSVGRSETLAHLPHAPHLLSRSVARSLVSQATMCTSRDHQPQGQGLKEQTPRQWQIERNAEEGVDELGNDDAVNELEVQFLRRRLPSTIDHGLDDALDDVLQTRVRDFADLVVADNEHNDAIIVKRKTMTQPSGDGSAVINSRDHTRRCKCRPYDAWRRRDSAHAHARELAPGRGNARSRRPTVHGPRHMPGIWRGNPGRAPVHPLQARHLRRADPRRHRGR